MDKYRYVIRILYWRIIGFFTMPLPSIILMKLFYSKCNKTYFPFFLLASMMGGGSQGIGEFIYEWVYYIPYTFRDYCQCVMLFSNYLQ